jgi:hypothetical protein
LLLHVPFLPIGVYAVRQQPYQIYPGDSFSTSFFFESDEEAIFGPASADEMCNSVLLYYPAQKLLGVAPWICIYDLPRNSLCNATLTTSAVEITDTATSSLSDGVTSFSTSDAYLERTFGYNTNGQCLEKSSSSLAISVGKSPLQLLGICALTVLLLL